MGCGSSKNKIATASTPRPPVNKPSANRKTRRPNSKTIAVKPKQDLKQTDSDLEGDNIEVPPADRCLSRDSLRSRGDGKRGFSASSKFSQHSNDSGFGGGADGKDLEGVITEDSPDHIVKQVEEEFESPSNLELGITGNAVPQRFSAKDKERLAEQRVLATLREEGLIQRPMSRAANGLSFEIVAKQASAADYMFNTEDQVRRPARLEKIEKRRKKKKSNLTQEEIEAKLERAERRRKEAEQQRLSKIASLNKSDVLTALDTFANMQKTKEEVQETKMDQATVNREKHLKELRDKLKAKQEHAEKVRRRKQTVVGDVSPRQATPIPRITEDTPVGAASRVNVTADKIRKHDDLPVGLNGSVA